jgi:hypothetical protein
VIVILPHLDLVGTPIHIGGGMTHFGDGIIVCYGVGMGIRTECFQDTTYNQIEYNHNNLQDTNEELLLGVDRIEWIMITFTHYEIKLFHEWKQNHHSRIHNRVGDNQLPM